MKNSLIRIFMLMFILSVTWVSPIYTELPETKLTVVSGYDQ